MGERRGEVSMNASKRYFSKESLKATQRLDELAR